MKRTVSWPVRTFAALTLVASASCLPAQPVTFTTVETYDPRAVTAAQIVPWNKIPVTVAHDAAGALVASAPDEPRSVLVSDHGTIALPADETVALADPLSAWLWYEAAGEGSRGTPKTLGQVVLSTPLANVRTVREHRGPIRHYPAVFIGLGAFFLAGATGAFYGAATTSHPGEIAGASVAGTLATSLAAYCISEGIYRIAGKDEDRVIYQARERGHDDASPVMR